jgi:hypothetical protein
VNQVVQLKKVTVAQLEEGILENVFKGGDNIEVEDFYELSKVNYHLVKSKPYTVLASAEELTSFSVEARELVASKKFAGIAIAKALLISGLSQRIIGNFYIRVNKPHINTKLFTDREEAIKWLREQYRLNINRLV